MIGRVVMALGQAATWWMDVLDVVVHKSGYGLVRPRFGVWLCFPIFFLLMSETVDAAQHKANRQRTGIRWARAMVIEWYTVGSCEARSIV